MQNANHYKNIQKVLPLSFYVSDDTLNISKHLLGKLLVTKINEEKTAGIIVETEAYLGINDKASHSYNNIKTKRNDAMFAKGGIAYIYLCYGIHNMFNIVTNNKHEPQAVLIRAVEPVIGVPTMLKRRKMNQLSYNLTSGPGRLTQALGLSLEFNKRSLSGPSLHICDIDKNIPYDNIIESPRVGIDYAEKDILRPWRFRIKNNPWCSH